jgi:hypothetical protein
MQIKDVLSHLVLFALNSRSNPDVAGIPLFSYLPLFVHSQLSRKREHVLEWSSSYSRALHVGKMTFNQHALRL